jgi:hypothetical protein
MKPKLKFRYSHTMHRVWPFSSRIYAIAQSGEGLDEFCWVIMIAWHRDPD